MKYIEELVAGDCFEFNNKKFLLTSDFRKNGQKLSYSLTDGFPFWINSQDVVDISPIYCLDSNNNIYPVKPSESTNAIN